MSTDRVDFTRGAAERISRAVRVVEQGDRDQSGPVYGKAGQEFTKVFRVGTFTGSWSKGAVKVVTLRYSESTLSALNLFAEISTSEGDRYCAIARDGTAWHLIAAEC